MAMSIQEEIASSPASARAYWNLVKSIIPVETVNRIIKHCQVVEQRQRDLPMVQVVWLCIMMSWQTGRSLSAVLSHVLMGERLWDAPETVRLPSRSAITQARYRLGAKPLVALFREVCHPLMSEPTEWSHAFGLHLVALDTSTETVADTPQNAHYFGRSTNQYGEGAYPSCRVAYLAECGTHAIFDAAIGRYSGSDVHLAWRLRRSILSNMLVLMDAGLTSFDFLRAIQDRDSHFLAPPSSGSHLKPYQFLDDGTYLTWIHPSAKSRQQKADPVLVRVITYTIHDPASPHYAQKRRLLTSLLDPDQYPAHKLVILYHERWEVEIIIDELDTHQRLPHQPFRSRKPVGVIQEFYAMLIAHYILRTFMLNTAQHYQLDPDRLSFTFTLNVVCDAFRFFQLLPSPFHPRLQQWLHAWIAQVIHPKRLLRWNPRIIKRHRSKFPRKQPQHFMPPKPTRSFADSIVLT